MKEEFELAMLDKYMVLFTCSRLDRNTVPENLFCYDVRHDDGCQGMACEVRPHILVNHWGTILSNEAIELDSEGSYYPEKDMNYLEGGFTIGEYLQLRNEKK